MISINEWMPNPLGVDTEGEWIELVNNGNTTVSLSGWKLKNEQGKSFVFKNQFLAPREYILLSRQETKLNLRNKDGGLFLYNNSGSLIDKASFFGSAREGASIVRSIEQSVTFTDKPTPGFANIVTSVHARESSQKIMSAHEEITLPSFQVFFLSVGFAFFITLVVLYATTRNDETSNILFGGNK